jgi:LPS-assembly protein
MGYRLSWIFWALLFMPTMAFAKDDAYQLSSNVPINISSNYLYYNKDTNIVSAKDNVEIVQNNEILFADSVILNRNEDIIYLEGNVAIKKSDGSVYFTDKAKLRRSEKKGFAIKFSARMGKKTLLASRSAEMVDDNTIVLDDMVISPCKICADNYIPFTPLWRFRASEATIDKKEEVIYYKHAKLDFLGVPIAYTPRLTSPTPGAKRKSGFLLPKFSHSAQTQGFTVGIPYYWNIAKNKDATITPMISKKGGEILFGQFRHKLKNGDYQLDGSIAHVQKTTKSGAKLDDKKTVKGHLEIKGAFDIPNPWNDGKLTFKSRRVFDPSKTYLQKYRISNDQILNTDVTYASFLDRDSYIARGLDFQDLRTSHNNKTTPKALPTVSIHKEKPLSRHAKGLKLISDINYLNLFRAQGKSYQRISAAEGLVLPMKMPYGQKFISSAVLRLDGYNVDKKTITVTDTAHKLNNSKEGVEGRVFPELRNEWNWSLYRRFNKNILIVEPVAQLMVAPKMTNLEKVGNEDSQSPEISASNLFSHNRYVGFDKVESGVRLNYGFRSNMSFDRFRNINLIFGQSIRDHKDLNFDKNSGLDGYRSDYVGKATIQPDEHIFLNDSFRMDEDNFSPLRNEASIDLSYPKWSISLTHLWIDKELIPFGTRKYRQEVGISGNYNFYKEWSVNSSISSRLGKKVPGDPNRITSTKYGLTYQGDCLYGSFTVSRDYARTKDLEPENTYSLILTVPIY